MALTLFICMVLLLILGFPVAFALAIAVAVAVFTGGVTHNWWCLKKCSQALIAFHSWPCLFLSLRLN